MLRQSEGDELNQEPALPPRRGMQTLLEKATTRWAPEHLADGKGLVHSLWRAGNTVPLPPWLLWVHPGWREGLQLGGTRSLHPRAARLALTGVCPWGP